MNEPKFPEVVTRRQFLSLLGVTTAAAAAAVALPGTTEAATAAGKVSAKKPSASRKATAKGGGPVPLQPTAVVSGDGRLARTLVVIELQGGNDGFSMLIPSGDPRFRQLRDRVWLDAKDMVRLDDRYSIAKGLSPLLGSLALIEGVGVPRPDLSHTAMMTRWWQGDPDGTAGLRTGFLGRCCDLFPTPSAITAMSVGGGATPALISERAATVALPDVGSLRELTQDRDDRMRPSLLALTEGGSDTTGIDAVDGDLLGRARAALASGLSLVGGLGGITGKATGYPDGALGASLSLVRELISLRAGIRILHVPWGSFDTHTGQRWSHADQMNRLGAALAAFRSDLVRHGLADQVLVATTSEFGRRPQANAGGTDHGTASTMALMGPVRSGRHGAPVDFNRLDRSGNVGATVTMNDYYATLAGWLGLPIAELMPGGGNAITSVGV